MKKITTLLAVFITFLTTVQAQKQELGNVSIEELKEKTHPKDSSAVAAFIFKKGKTSFAYNQNEGFSIVTEVEMKIKFYKKEGYEWANISLPVYIGGNSKETVTFSKAVTYNLINGQIEKTKAKSENEFSEQKNKYWGIRKITMPNVKEGSIIELKYSVYSPYISNFPEWKFQKTIPVNFSEYTTDIPEYFIYNVHRKGALFPIETKEKLSKMIRLDERYSSVNRQVGYLHDVENVNYMDNRTVYKLENIPAISEESYVNNMDNYTPSVILEHSGTQFPQKAYVGYSSTWEDVSKNIYENDDFGSQLDKNNYFEEALKNLLQGLTSNEDKINAIFNFVKSRMTWNKYFSYACDAGVKKAYQDMTGNTADINLMLVSMLRYANLESNPVLVSTRANGIALYPSRSAFNTVIASVVLDDKIVLLDATSKNAFPNILPLRDLNWFGRIIRKDGTSDMVNLMPESASQDVVNIIATLDSSGQVTGKLREQYLDYDALRFRENYAGLAKDAIVEKIEKKHSGLEIENYELINDIDTDESVIEKYSFRNGNASEIVSDKIYISPLLQLESSENPFKQELREFPIDFSFPNKEKYMISLTIPDGYQVESMPKSIAIAMDKGYGNFSFTSSNTNNQLQINVVLNINTSIIPAEDYGTLKEFYKLITEKETEKIVIKKI